jgi:hypothetical protein
MAGCNSEVGSGFFYVETGSGTSKDGNIPKVSFDDDIIFGEVSYSAYLLDDSYATYIYQDGELLTIEYSGEFDGKLLLPGGSKFIEPGIHKAEAVQYEDNTEGNKKTFYRLAKFEIVD